MDYPYSLEPLNNVVNGVWTAPWVMTALADRFLLIASLLPKDVYCLFRSKQSTFLYLNSTKYTTNLYLYLVGLSARYGRPYISWYSRSADRRSAGGHVFSQPPGADSSISTAPPAPSCGYTRIKGRPLIEPLVNPDHRVIGAIRAPSIYKKVLPT